MSDVSPYGVTQHADAEMMTANAMVGERLSPVTVNATVGSAAMFSTAPYIPPRPPKVKPTKPRCQGKEGTCKAGPIGDTGLCWFHTKQAAAAR